jgi:hypothetical protein
MLSLIEIRRERRQGSGGPTRPPRLWKMLLTLGVVIFLIWYLSQVT